MGKYFGAGISARITKCEPGIVRYLGITLLPQAGVALGMASQALAFGSSTGKLVQSITLFAVLVYEIFGPVLTRWALTKAGDIQPEGKTSARHEYLRYLLEKAHLIHDSHTHNARRHESHEEDLSGKNG